MIPEIFWGYNSCLLVWQLGWRWLQHVSPETWYHAATHRRREQYHVHRYDNLKSLCFRSFFLKIHWFLASENSRDKKKNSKLETLRGNLLSPTWSLSSCGGTKTFTIKQKLLRVSAAGYSVHWKFVNFQWPRICPSVYYSNIHKMEIFIKVCHWKFVNFQWPRICPSV